MTNDLDTLFSDENAQRTDELLKLREAEANRLAKRLVPRMSVGKMLAFRRMADLPRIGKEDPVDANQTP